MRRMIATGATDTGRMRKGNEDALLLRSSVFAVADGMGGHLAGEVASAKALEPIEELDGQLFPDAAEAVQALRDAVVAANATVSELAASEPSYRGMGTTLTATMVEGCRMHIAHVGDSRAYLLRGGQFSQLTDDHTLVQHLVDEGQITREEAASHPQRSIITRAIGVSRSVDVDSMTLDLEPGDQVLLCSDGLTGVVEDEDIARVLGRREDPDDTVEELIRLANEGGGPDNITVVLLRYEDPTRLARLETERQAAKRAAAAEQHADPSRSNGSRRRGRSAAQRTGATGTGGTGGTGDDTDGDAEAADHVAPIAISTRDDRPNDDWAGRLGSYGALARDHEFGVAGDEEPRQAGRVLGRAAAIVLGLALLIGVIAGGARFLLSQSYFVGLDGEAVVIYQGIDTQVGPFDLASVRERTDLTLEDVPPWYHPALESGRTAADLNDARRIVANVPTRTEAADDDAGADTTDPDAGTDAGADANADADAGADADEDADADTTDPGATS